MQTRTTDPLTPPTRLSLSTDYAADVGCPEPALRAIAAAGFTHVHWCHQWSTDFLYSRHELDQIAHWLGEYELSLTDIHGSAGREKRWVSDREYERLAGVQLVANRIEMAETLGTDTIVMHVPAAPHDAEQNTPYWDRLRKSLDGLEPRARACGVRLALENLCPDNFDVLGRVFDLYEPGFVGLCYDSGHGNLCGNGLERLVDFSDRLIAVHLHDNDGTADQHNLPFTGTVDWPRLAGLLAGSAYAKWVNLEVTVHGSGIEDEAEFLAEAFRTASHLARMVEAAR